MKSGRDVLLLEARDHTALSDMYAKHDKRSVLLYSWRGFLGCIKAADASTDGVTVVPKVAPRIHVAR